MKLRVSGRDDVFVIVKLNLWFDGAASVAIDGALLVSGGTVLFLLGDGFEVGCVVFGRHGDRAVEEAGEGRVLVEEGAALSVDVEDIERAGTFSELGFDAAKKLLQDGGLEWVKEKDKRWGGGKVEGESVLLKQANRSKARGGAVGGVGLVPAV